jgi:Tol biopolymer transport system component
MARESFNKLLMIPLTAPTGPSYEASLQCERAYFAANRGVCLTVEGELTPTNYAYIFDDRFMKMHRIVLTGIPSRTRVSPDGRRAAITVFEHGHSYAEAGFSTRTSILDTISGRIIGDLEQFRIWRDGKRFQVVDFNFWGLTFKADGNGFFATLASGGTKYLIEGDIDAREGRVLRIGVECPSLSPDNTKLVYKNLIHDWGFWQLRVYNLQTGTDTALTTETRSVDDQVDWLDNDDVLYHITGARGADVWALNTNGTESPRVLREYAYSPAVVR